MHAQITAHTVSGAVTIVDAVLPHRVSCQHIKLCSAGSNGEFGHCQTYVSLQYQRIVGALFLGESAQRDGSCDVGGAVLVLRTAVEQQQPVWFQGDVGLLARLVVYDGTMMGIACDGVEGDIPVQWLLGTQGCQAGIHAHLCLVTGLHRRLEPAQELHQRHSVMQHSLAESLALGLVLDGLHGCDERTAADDAPAHSIGRKHAAVA